ncbi:MAG TPA: phosphoglucosamine mutase [Candidatus Aminicenantes bacterium]|nr:phosphoglucosamine mutase [Candidatus Aminicenantes bacterium]
MKKRLFGTDGVRGTAGAFPLDPPTIARLGQALVGLLERKGLDGRLLIGRDTRESGPWMERALARGVRAAGGEAVSAGVVPTSAVSYLTKTHGYAAGAVISASHNPFQDNGIKVFSRDGVKLPDEWELEVEADVLEGRGRLPGQEREVFADPRLAVDYLDYLAGRVRRTGRRSALKVVVDCANGASSFLAPLVLGGLGFGVEAIHCAPDGKNINLGCGSLHPEALAARVRESGAAMGIAYDGDADRALWVDGTGRLLSGDHTLFVQALHMKRSGRLRTNEVVATSMSNMGLEAALGEHGLGLVRTKVGDKYVHDEMVARGANLGGEQSGHTIFLDDLPTGDGLLTSLRMLEVMAERGETLSGLVRDMAEYPQTLVNVRVTRKPDFAEFPDIVAAVEETRARLGREGRLDLRYSGTEPLARIMVEARDPALVEAAAKRVADAVRERLGEKP